MSNYEILMELSRFNARTQNQINILLQEDDNLLPTRLEFKDNVVSFGFACEEGRLLSNINLTLQEQMIVFMNLCKLVKLDEKIDFSLNPQNIYIDYSLNPKILCRDIKTENDYSLIDKIKACVGATINKEYSYEDYLCGGVDLLSKTRLSNLAQATDIESLKSILSTDINNIKKDLKNNYMLIKKRKITTKNIVMYMTLILSILLVVISIFLGIKLMKETKQINIYNLYTSQKYSEVVEQSKSLNVDNMSENLLYTVANSVIMSQKLDESKKNHLLSQISIDGNQDILMFWVLLGQEKFEEAQDIAYKLNDKDLLVYCNLKELDSVINSSNLSASKKEEKRKQIEGKLNELGVSVNK